ncbi:DNA polymerase III subunit alpha [Dongia soli]|uniref:DNA polymerase III subunit alpha n=1 Tax=Dongia soli TaxID=600628 RepID=A0ABU5EA00_9PROT|nr:DNA polymerase III subunit alpha [Dongia soli]MDY0883028.1 DNA polymerase III subunit alpha [Dongia soli]
MPYADFVHLRVHSAYSLSEGAVKNKQLVELAKRNDMPAVAVTDTGALFGIMEFSGYAKDAGIQPIIGCQLGVARVDVEPQRGTQPPPDPLVVLVQNDVGYQNLMKLVSHAFLETEPGLAPQVSLDLLTQHSEGLLALTGGPAGEVGRLLLEGQQAAAEEALKRLAAIFPGRFYVEIMRHGMPAEQKTEDAFIELAYELDLPLVATNEVFFSDEGMYAAHDALLCIAGSTYVGEKDRRRVTRAHGFKSAREMRELFADLPEAVDNTLVVAQRCAFMPPARKPILPAFSVEIAEADVLKQKAMEGLDARMKAANIEGDARKPYDERLEFELNTIIQMGFPGYFLIVADFIQWAKKNGIPVGPGRGSGAGSVVAWALTITDLDPLRWGLLFERFLNPERVSMPDFDVDFCQDRRDEVIRYVQERYGRDRVAQIITFGKLQARAAVRDVGRVLQMPYGQIDKLSKLIPNNPANPISLKDAIASEPQLRQVQEDDPMVKRLMEIAQKIEGLYRHASTHAAGVVIGDRPLNELVPLYRDPRSDMPVTQFNMKDVEKAGLVKFDFLGLKTLTVLVTAVKQLAKRDIEVDLNQLPLDDRKTYEMLGQGDSTGVFQLESSGMRDVLKKLKPDRFEDIIAVVALYRPGPMDNIPRYINCKHGREEPDYLYPSLEGILKETFGIMIYQEQVMQIAQVLSGYSLGGADLLRRAMGKKIKEEMEAQRKLFVDGAVERGVPEEKAGQIFDQVNKFAGYGFNKSHAAAYALVSYQTAWLKANYPVEFFAASMTYDMGNTEKLNVFRQELNRIGVKLLPPDVNKSMPTFAVEKQDDGSLAVRYALAAVKNVGMGAMEHMVANREEHGPFRSLADFCERIDPKSINKRQLENLVVAGAFESLNANRRQVYEAVEQMLRQAGAAQEARTSNQNSLFGDAAKVTLTLPPTPDWPSMEKLQHEFGAIGFYLSAHPLDSYGASLKRLEAVPYAELPAYMRARGTARAKVAGLLVGKQERTSAKGNRFAFVQLTDPSGLFEATIFSERLNEARELLEPGRALLLTVDLRMEEDSLRLLIHSVEALDQAASNTGAGLRVFLREPSPIESLKQILTRAGRGKGKVELLLDLAEDQREVAIALPGRFAISPVVRGAIKAVPGIVDIVDT